MFQFNKLQTKLFICYSIIIVFVVTIAASSFYIYISRITIKQTEQNQNQLTASILGQLDVILANMDRTSLIVISNPTIKQVFSGIKRDKNVSNYFSTVPEERQRIFDTLVFISLDNNQTTFRTSLYNKDGDYISFGIADTQNVILKRTQAQNYGHWYRSLVEHSKKVILSTHDDFWSEDKSLRMISLLREIILPDTNLPIGIVEVQWPYSELASILEQNGQGARQLYLLGNKGEIVYPFKQNSAKSIAKAYLKAIEASKDGNLHLLNPNTKQKEILSYRKSSFSGWTLIISEPEKTLLKPIRLIGMIIVFTGIGLLFITLLLIYFLTNHLTRPLKLLRNSVRKVNIDNLAISLTQSGGIDEINELNTAFDSMFSRLKDSMNELVQTKAHEMKAHMIALQSQMDPHFLYNMLSVISAYSQETGSEKITEICSLLSSMLRYSTEYSEDLSTINAEMEHVEKYLKLMKIRFEYKLAFDVQMSDFFYKNSVAIPKLTLQPLVENCFQHGFKKVSPPWSLQVIASTKDDFWMIEVTDNGCGFDENKISLLRLQVDAFLQDPSNNIKHLKLGGMGLVNTLVRLKLLYRDEMIFKIEKNEDRGTKMILGGPMNVQSDGR